MNPDYQALAAWLLAILGVPEEIVEFLEQLVEWSTPTAPRTLLQPQPSFEFFHFSFLLGSERLLARCAFGLSFAISLLGLAHSLLLVSRSLTFLAFGVHQNEAAVSAVPEPLDYAGALVGRDVNLQRRVRSQVANQVALILQRDRGCHEDEADLRGVAGAAEAPRFLRIERSRQLEEKPAVVEEERDDVDVLLHQLSVHPEDVGRGQRVHRSHATAAERHLIERSERIALTKGGA